jgi:hypothetical protein
MSSAISVSLKATLGSEGKCAIFQFHHHALQHLLGLRQVEQLQDHWLLASQHVPVGDAKQRGVTDLSSRAGDGDSYRCFHGVLLQQNAKHDSSFNFLMLLLRCSMATLFFGHL